MRWSMVQAAGSERSHDRRSRGRKRGRRSLTRLLVHLPWGPIPTSSFAGLSFLGLPSGSPQKKRCIIRKLLTISTSVLMDLEDCIQLSVSLAYRQIGWVLFAHLFWAVYTKHQPSSSIAGTCHRIAERRKQSRISHHWCGRHPCWASKL